MSKFITLHILNDISWSNLNRDDSGAPKRTLLGGVERGLLSSQSIKRAARKDYESRILTLNPSEYNDSYRSRNLSEIVVERAKAILNKIDSEIDEKKLTSRANKLIKSLTGKETAAKETVTWLSMEELETLAAIIADDADSEKIEKLSSAKNPNEAFEMFMKDRGATGSLAIAAFGRMFANATKFQTEAAISVSPAISTHGSLIETDYFITADDRQAADDFAGAGAGHLGVAFYTSGVFYRSITIDISELWKNWTGKNSEFAEAQLQQFIKSLVYSLPTGKKNHTAPYSEPLLVIAEMQNYRQSYSVSAAVSTPDEFGFQKKSSEMLKKQFEIAREISGENYGETIVSGVRKDDFDDVANTGSIADVISEIILWLELDKPVVVEEVNSDSSELPAF